MPPVLSMCQWLCAHRSCFSAFRTCPMLTQCTSILWNGSLASSRLAFLTLREQVQSSSTVNVVMHSARIIHFLTHFLDFSDSLKNRIANINEFFTFSLYSNVCRSLFEKHKLMFAFLLCARIMMNENKIDMVRKCSLCQSLYK